MKKTSLIMLALCAGAPMFAQSAGTMQVGSDGFISIYGVLDAGVGHVEHTQNFDGYFPASVNPTATKKGYDSATGMFNGGISGTRLGFKGEKGLGDGWKAIFTLEAGISTTTGVVNNAALGLAQNSAAGANMSADSAVSGQLFARGAYFGVSNDTYGTIMIGRNTSFMLDVIGATDALQGAQMFTPIGFSGSYGGGGATDDSRIDNSIKYKLKFGEFNLGLAHKFGGVSGSSNSQTSNQVNLGYERQSWGIQAVYEGFRDAFSVANPSATATVTTITPAVAATPTTKAVPAVTVTTYAQPLGTIAVTAYDTSSIMLSGHYKIGNLYLNLGYERETFSNPSNPGLDGAITSLLGQVVSSVTTNKLTIGGANMTKVVNVTWLGANYSITPKLNVGVAYYQIYQDDYSNGTYTNTVPQATQASSGPGKSVYQSLLVDYNWTKSFDLYAGYMGNTLSNAMASGYTFPTNSVLGLGARFKF